ncbi:hypothetical protein [Peribacillus frigoritolerans]|uniref:hypothetical protein n=1 Tax=Peribacillus frigoritolerans TaxID=450367 RepID=UPI002E250138|nr:hypothetical protein [Peribacillus frigoritolerans]
MPKGKKGRKKDSIKKRTMGYKYFCVNVVLPFEPGDVFLLEGIAQSHYAHDIFEVRSCQSRQLFRYSINTRGSSLALSFFGGRNVYFNGSLITDFLFWFGWDNTLN